MGGSVWTEPDGLPACASAAIAEEVGLGLRNTQRVGIGRGHLAAVADPRTLVPSVVDEGGDEDENEQDQYPEPETHVVPRC
jgi:hypothetical protein